MTVYTLVETIQKHFPEKGAREIITVANRVLMEISRRTGHWSREYTLYTTDGEEIYINLSGQVRRVSRVDLDDTQLEALSEPPAGLHVPDTGGDPQ